MNEMTDLPEWVWQVVEATLKYDEEHPPLYRYVGKTGSGKELDGFERYDCLDRILLGIIPANVRETAKVLRWRKVSK